MNQTSPVQPGLLVRSFLVVALHWMAIIFGLLMSMLLIAWLAFPEIYRLWTLSEDQSQPFYNTWENNPELLFPAGMCWGLIGANAFLSFVAGLSTGWFAPFAPARHGVFMAILLIVTFLQMALSQPELPKWMMAGFLLVSPTSVVAGSRIASRWRDRREDFGEESVEMPYD
jgi:hypothetical protein